MIQFDRVEKSYGDQVLFRDLSWQLRPGQRIGLIGPNGAGKSTLFKLLMEEFEPDKGRVSIPRGTTIGMLPQELEIFEDIPLLQFVLSGQQELLELETEMSHLESAIANSSNTTETERLAQELGALQERYELNDGYSFRTTAKSILTGMGFSATDYERSARELSGGWRVRLALSKLLLQRPDVLLMDEPTNHLDLPSLEWLEEFLQNYEGTLVVISHDRYFLDRLVNEIAALEVDGFYSHPGQYSDYQSSRQVRLEQLERAKVQQDKKIKQTERFISRFRYKNTKAKQVQSRVKQLDKLERIELPQNRKTFSFQFPEEIRPGKKVISLDKVTFGYNETPIYEDLVHHIERGERVVLVGPNGEGKTTLLKLIAGELSANRGDLSLGHNVALGYFAQHQVEALDLSRTALAEMEANATTESFSRCRGILGAFLFSGDDVEKHISVLSGGERMRLSLAKLLLKPSNLLLLDEPTNHLDITSIDILLDALKQYTGTIVFVSHDRRFINALATRVVHVADRALTSYHGDYEYYRFKRTEEQSVQAGNQGASKKKPSAHRTRDKKTKKREEAQQRNAQYRKLGPLQRALEEINKEIADLEKLKENLEMELANPELYGTPDKLKEISEAHGENARLLNERYNQWMEICEDIEEAKRS